MTVVTLSNAVTVRVVQAADVPAVVALITNVLAEFGLCFGSGSDTDEQVLKLPHSYDAGGGRFWVAEQNGVLLGTCGVYPVNQSEIELRKMYLSPASRGLGIGTKLLDVALSWAKERQFKAVVLDTVHEMQQAIAFYERHGFVRDDKQIRGSRCSRGYRLELPHTSS